MARNGSAAGTPVGEGPEFDAWLDQRKEAYRKSLERLLENTAAGDHAAADSVFERMRAANEGVIDKSAHILGDRRAQALRGALEEVVAEFRAERTGVEAVAVPETTGVPEQPERPGRSGVRGRSVSAFALGALAGVVLAVGGLWLLSFADRAAVAFGRQSVASQRAYRASHADGLRHLATTVKVLREVETEVKRRQEQDAEALTRLAGEKLIPLARFSPELAKDASLPDNTRVLVKANAQGYKIVANSPICGVVKIARPAMVDPVRDSSVGCRHFGIWNAPGAQF